MKKTILVLLVMFLCSQALAADTFKKVGDKKLEVTRQITETVDIEQLQRDRENTVKEIGYRQDEIVKLQNLLVYIDNLIAEYNKK